jgi:Zn finger protein HypA/HybF involved in hydrogenase expression
MTVAIRGAIILDERNGMIKWNAKCDSCGNVESNLTRSQAAPSKSSTLNTSFVCPKCHKSQQVQLKG